MDDKALNDLARRLVDLREEKRYLETQIELVSRDLVEALGEGTKRDLGGVQVRVSTAKPSLRIVTAADVPPAFRSLQPDRRLLLQHIARTGEIPAGVEVTKTRPIVFAKTPGDHAGETEDGSGSED